MQKRSRPVVGQSAQTFAPPSRVLDFAVRDLLAQLASLGERAGSAAGAVVSWALGVYHGLRRKHLQTYLDEFVFRFNRRRA
jgi:transposase-like protein